MPTEQTGTAEGNGAKLVSHAKTLGVNLLNGLIKVDAIETTATVEANSTIAPHAEMDTEFLGLTIGGKKFPVHPGPNAGITIPGVATASSPRAGSGKAGSQSSSTLAETEKVA